jgi:hypothetical protein
MKIFAILLFVIKGPSLIVTSRHLRFAFKKFQKFRNFFTTFFRIINNTSTITMICLVLAILLPNIVYGQWVASYPSISDSDLSSGPSRLKSMSLRSSEEREFKSPLADHLSGSLISEEAVGSPIEVTSSTEQPSSPVYPRRQGRRRAHLLRLPRRKQQNVNGNDIIRKPPVFRYDSNPSRSMMSDYLNNQPVLIGFPVNYRTAERESVNRKVYRKPHRITTSVRAETGVVSSNPPEFITVESSNPVEVFPPKKFNKKLYKKQLEKQAIVSAPVIEREVESMERLTPDRHLGNDMLYYPENPISSNSGNDLENDPNADFVMIK